MLNTKKLKELIEVVPLKLSKICADVELNYSSMFGTLINNRELRVNESMLLETKLKEYAAKINEILDETNV